MLLSSLRYFSRILSLLLLLAAAGCTKELSNEGRQVQEPGVAAYTLGNCSDAVVAGTYKAGTLLSTDAVLKIRVYVTAPGSWMMNTSLINGVIFSGAGTFSATGMQVVSLQASGRPERAGNFSYGVKAGNSTCSVSLTVIPAIVTPTEEFYFRMTVGGKYYFKGVTQDNHYVTSPVKVGATEVMTGTTITYPTSGIELPKGEMELSVLKGVLSDYPNVTKEVYAAFLKPGNYPYPAVSGQVFAAGIIIRWTDEQGGNWSTLSGTGNQSGSSFTILTAEEMPGPGGFYYLKVKMQFTCKLYNEVTGEMKQVTDGEMVGAFGKI